MTNVGPIVSEILIDIEKLEGQIQLAKGKLDKFAAGQQQNQEKFRKGWTRAFGAFAAAATGFQALRGLRNQLTETISVFGDFEEALITAAAKTEDAASNTEKFTESFNSLSNAAKEAGESTIFTAEQSAQALQFFAAAGFNAEDSINSLQGTLALATATGSDLRKTAGAVTSVISQFGKEFTTADQIANTFTKTITSTKADLGFLQQSFKFAGTTTSILGTSLEQTAAAMGILADAGFSGTQAGRSLRGALNDLTKEAGPTTQRLLALSDQLTFDQIDPTNNNLLQILQNIQDAGISAGDVFTVFNKEVGTQFATLLKNTSKLEDLTGELENSNQAYEIQDKILEGLNAKQKLLTSAIQAFRIELAEALAPAIKFVLDGLTSFFRALANAPKVFQVVGAGISAVAIAAAALIPIVKVLGATLVATLGPWALIAAAVVGVTAGVVAYAGRVSDAEKATIALKDETEKYKRELSSLTDEQLRAEKVDLTKKINDLSEATRKAKKDNQDLKDSEVKGGAATRRKTRDLKDQKGEIALLNIEQEEYRKRLEALNKLEADRAKAEAAKEAERQAQATENLKRTTQDYQDQLEKLLGTEREAIEVDRRNAIQRAKSLKGTTAETQEATDAINAYYDALLQPKKLEDFLSALEFVQQGLSAVADLSAAITDRRLADLDRQQAKELEAISSLKESEQERLQRELEDAKATGDQKLIDEADYNLRKFEIDKKYDEKRKELEYKGALTSWRFQVAQALANTAQAVVSTLAQQPGGVISKKAAAGIIGGLGAVQVGAVLAAKPQRPSFETGGIVPGTSYSGDSVQANVNSGEMILTREQQAGLFDAIQSLASTGGAPTGGGATTNVYLDRKLIESVVNDGLKNQRITVPKRVVV